MGGITGFVGRRPLVAAAVAFALGAEASACLGSRSSVPWLSAALLLFAAAFGFSRRAPGASTLLTFLCFLLAGIGLSAERSAVSGAPSIPSQQYLEGIVEGLPKRDGDRLRLLLDVRCVGSPSSCQPSRFRVRLSCTASFRPLAGDRIGVIASLLPAPPAANPGAVDLAARARREGVLAYGSIVGAQSVVLGAPHPGSLELASYRRAFSALAADAIPEPDRRSLVKAFALGDREDLSPEINEDFGASGLAHVLSVSGLHIAVLAAGLYRVLRWLLGRSETLLLGVGTRACAAALTLPATWLYVAATGSEVPAVRSGLMASAILSAVVLGRDAHAPTSLAAALLTVMAFDPAALHDLSFQLSFLSVAGLLLLARPLRRLVPIPSPEPAARGFRASLARGLELALSAGCASLAASLATAPLIAAAFHRTSLVSVLANSVTLPAASALTVVSAASAAAFAVLEPLAAALLCLASPLSALVLGSAEFFGSLPFASAWVAGPSVPTSVAWYGLLAALPLHEASRKLARTMALGSGAVLLASLANSALAPALDQRLQVTFFSVGTGDSALIRFPGGRTLLLDGGGDTAGRFDVGERAVIPALLELGAGRLDAVALSHPHPDHAQGLLSVLRRLPTEEVWLPAATAHEPLSREVTRLAQARGSRLRLLEAGDSPGSFAPARVEILHPARDALGLGGNDASLVLSVSLGEVSFLFLGDVEEAGEQALLASPWPGARVVKVPHHGSPTSSSLGLVRRVQARHCVISVGRNRFGFPNREVVSRWEAGGCTIHRTDLQGAITFTTDGTTLEVGSHLGD